MKFWATIRGDQELYIEFNPGDPGAWDLAYPDFVDWWVAAGLTEGEVEAIDQQITDIMSDPHAWDEQP